MATSLALENDSSLPQGYIKVNGTTSATLTTDSIIVLKIISTTLSGSTSYANDVAAAAGGVAVGQFYRNGSVVQIRVS
jgi:hypothetical protein